MVSVIIPYNIDRGFLKEAEKSLADQTYQNFEVKKKPSPNTAGYNFNQNLKECKGDFVCYLCEDDLLPKDSLEIRVNAMQDFDFIHGYGTQFGDNLGIWHLTKKEVTLKGMLNQNQIMGGTTMYRRELLEKFPFDETLWTGEEYDLHLRLLSNGCKLGFVDKVVYLYRRHERQKSLGNQDQVYQNKRAEQIRMIKDRYDRFA